MTDQPRDVVFLDCETSGLDPRVHDAWEVAAWNLTTGHRCSFFVHIPDMPGFMAAASPVALRIGRFLDRYPLDDTAPSHGDTSGALFALGEVFDGGRSVSWSEFPRPVVIGSNPGFDLAFLGKLMRAYQYDPERQPWWHHHPIDLGSYAAGVLGIEIGTQSLSAESVAKLCGIEPGGHSAEGDVTSGGRCYLLLREAARRARAGHHARKWIEANPLPETPHLIEAELLVPVA